MAREYERLVQAVHADPDPDHRAEAMRTIGDAAQYVGPGDTGPADAICAPVLARVYPGHSDAPEGTVT
jgi:hypothetical protein